MHSLFRSESMMSDCCHDKSCILTALRQRQAQVLWIVLAINVVMFAVELTAGLRANSLSLAGDSLDMLGDALVYGSSLYVLERSARAQAKSAFLKGNIMALSAIAVFARAFYQLARGTTPSLGTMSVVGVLVLAANLVCLALLTRHRADKLEHVSRLAVLAQRHHCQYGCAGSGWIGSADRFVLAGFVGWSANCRCVREISW